LIILLVFILFANVFAEPKNENDLKKNLDIVLKNRNPLFEFGDVNDAQPILDEGLRKKVVEFSVKERLNPFLASRFGNLAGYDFVLLLDDSGSINVHIIVMLE
jgi:hypothetical protein